MNLHNNPTIIGVSIIGNKNILNNRLPASPSLFNASANNKPKRNSNKTERKTNTPVQNKEERNIPSENARKKFSKPTKETLSKGLDNDRFVKLIHTE